jgi:Protein of unknown function (DUF4038)
MLAWVPMCGWRQRLASARLMGSVSICSSALLFACGSSDDEPANAAGGGSSTGGTGGSSGTGGSGGSSSAGATGGASGSGGAAGERFPLAQSSGERFLREASGNPFFFQGDSGWSLIAELSEEDAEIYLEDRRQKGFSVVLVNLIEHEFSDQAPKNAYGDSPFTTPGDFSMPNEAYFAHADWVIDRAAAKGLLVLLAPAYLGYGGGSEGFYQDMVASGAAKLESYGHFLGKRYASKPNILWLEGGDYDPPSAELVDAVVTGIRAEDTVHLHSAHTSRGESASDVWGQEPWLDVDNVYTDSETHAPSLALGQTTTKPFFLIEAYYEGEHQISAEDLRYQAYGALLSGAMGQLFGNNPIWCFGASTCFPTSASPPTWQAQLDGRGSKDMAVLAGVFTALAWEKLSPDDGLITQDSTNAIGARASDGSLALVYTRSLGQFVLDASGFAAPIQAVRIDPTSGSEAPLPGSPLPASGTSTITLDTANATGGEDWLLRFSTQ